MEYDGLQSLQKRLNYVKLVFLFLDVGASVLVKTLEHLYRGSKPLEHNLVDLTKEKPSNFYAAEKETLERLKEGDLKLSQLDITLTYKLIQLTCGLTDRNSPEGRLLWSKQCPVEKQRCLEHLLFRYKEMRNEIIHEFKKLEALFDDAFERIRLKCEDLLTAITAEVELRARLPQEETKAWRQLLSGNMAAICQWDLSPSDSGGSGGPPNRSPSPKVASKIKPEADGPVSQSMGMSNPSIKKSIPESYPEEEESELQCFGWKNINKIVTGDLIRSGILSRYGQDLPARDPLGQKQTSFSKSDRNYWIDRLLSTNILDDNNSLLRFVQEYSGDQR